MRIEELKSALKELTTEELAELRAFVTKLIEERNVSAQNKVRVCFPSSLLGDRRKARSGTYIKVVRAVDLTKTNGYALIGEFVPTDKEVDLPSGAVVVVASGVGSWKHPETAYFVLRAREGSIWKCPYTRAAATVENVECLGEFTQTTFLSLRDFVHKVLTETGV
ncbi:MAG: hypothetical protein QXT00_02390 [Ignisphaera sp.]